VTRESIPRFDLYAELEVARTASEATIEAAYRSMAKRHHPDLVSERRREAAEERIKRINTARDWLTDPERRQRYDRDWRERDGSAAGATVIRDDPTHRPAPWSSFGPNTDRVRQFLADIRDLDEQRAVQVRDGKASLDPDDYAHAKRAAFAISRSRRLSEWLFARDAATAVVLGQLQGRPLATETGETLADVAGAIAVRDLLPPEVFDTLLEPWTWRSQTIAAKTQVWTVPLKPPPPRPAAGARPVPPPPPPVLPRAQPRPPAAGPLAAGSFAGGPLAKATSARASTAAADRRVAIGLVAASMTGLIVVATLIGASSLFAPKFTGGVEGLQASGAFVPSLAPVANASLQPTAPPPAPTTTPGISPAKLASLQHGAWDTIRRLKLYAIAINVPGAQRLLGDTAPGLRGSGLQRAIFPTLNPAEITIAQRGSGWQATAAKDTLTSSDGTHWIFAYGARPLARFTSTAIRHLYFVAPSGDHHQVDVRLTSVSIYRSAIVAAFTWTYGPDSRYGNDGPWFSGDRLVVSSVTIGGRSIPISGGLVANLGTATLSGLTRIGGEKLLPGAVVVNVAVVDPVRGEAAASFALGS
jgi:curved DNA-binding protein CbpA